MSPKGPWIIGFIIFEIMRRAFKRWDLEGLWVPEGLWYLNFFVSLPCHNMSSFVLWVHLPHDGLPKVLSVVVFLFFLKGVARLALNALSSCFCLRCICISVHHHDLKILGANAPEYTLSSWGSEETIYCRWMTIYHLKLAILK